MIARVSLEIALRKEFDYLVPAELASKVDVGSRVQVPFGARKILGVVTAVAEESAQANLKPIIKVIGAQTLITPKVLQLARWIGEYYCCAPETALKSVLPEAVRKEDASWRERLFVRVQPLIGEFPKLPKRQQDVWNIVEERREILLSELVQLATTTAATVRKLEDRGLISITNEVSERDPYANETILASQPIVLNPAQEVALEKIKTAMGSTGFQPVVSGVTPETAEQYGQPLIRSIKNKRTTSDKIRRDAGFDGRDTRATFYFQPCAGIARSRMLLSPSQSVSRSGQLWMLASFERWPWLKPCPPFA